MKPSIALISSVVLLGSLAYTMPVIAADEHKVVTSGDVAWGPGPPALPKGVQGVTLYGDPSKEGLFVLRLKFPAGLHVPPHSHPVPEVITVLSGTLRLGTGETADKGKTKVLPAGSFSAMSAGMKHYGYFDEETVIQLSTNGPWGVTYVNEKDDPRKTN
jgi:quercetin dioxygenase-like cupin family protein